ncbi:hypothetical protein [Niveispirillum sp. KHB5.9]|uniref:hypothetical protein n=1 Tax=Niveispirillum sp. KHB5.9 TaxID=3400269 RepID=UPI003A868301
MDISTFSTPIVLTLSLIYFFTAIWIKSNITQKNTSKNYHFAETIFNINVKNYTSKAIILGLFVGIFLCIVSIIIVLTFSKVTSTTKQYKPDTGVDAFIYVFFSPIFETLVIAAISIPFRVTGQRLAYIVTIAALAAYLHAPYIIWKTPQIVLGFAVMAMLFDIWYAQRNWTTAFWGVLSIHIVYNLGLLVFKNTI